MPGVTLKSQTYRAFVGTSIKRPTRGNRRWPLDRIGGGWCTLIFFTIGLIAESDKRVDSPFHLPHTLFLLRVRRRTISTRKENVANNVWSVLMRFRDNSWELGNDFVKIRHVKNVWQRKESAVRAGWRVWYLTQIVWTDQFCVTLLLTPFPVLFHLLATGLCLYHGWKFLWEPCTWFWTPRGRNSHIKMTGLLVVIFKD